MQPSVKLQIFGYCLHPLPDPVADDQEKEAPTPEVRGKRIVELLFVDLRVNRPHHLEQWVAVARLRRWLASRCTSDEDQRLSSLA